MSRSNERRQFERFTINLRGLIGTHDGSQQPCVIRDYCAGGMLVQCLESTGQTANSRLPVGESVRLNTEFLTESGPRPFRISAKVVWVRDNDLGIAFDQQSDAVVAGLRRHDRLARAEVAHPVVGNLNSEARCLARLRRIAAAFLPDVAEQLLREAASDVLAAAAESQSNVVQQQLFEDISSLERPSGKARLSEELLEHGVSADMAEPALERGGSELALIDTGEFERWLQASHLAERIEADFSEALDELGAGFASLTCTGESDQSRLLPFGPRQLAAGLKAFAERLELGESARELLFQRASLVLSGKLGTLYRSMIDALHQMGASTQRPKPTVAVRRAKEQQSELAGQGEPTVGSDGQAVAGVSPAASPFGEVAQGLDPQMLAQLLANEAKRRQSLAEELLAGLYAAEAASPGLQRWIDQLNEPLTRAAVADPGFFQNREHPVRMLIDGLRHLEIFRATDVDDSDDPLVQQVEKAIAPIHGAATDPSVIRDAVTQIAALTQKQSQIYNRNAERAAQASEGRDRLRRAARAVARELDRRYEGRKVPALVLELLEGGWRALLELAYLRDEEGEGLYADYLGLLDGVVARGGGVAFERGSAERDPQALLRAVVHELSSTAFDPFRRNDIEIGLRKLLIFADGGKPELVAMPAQSADAEEGSGEPPDGISPAAWEYANEQCGSIRVGDRIRFASGEAEGLELRVGWIRNDHGEFTLLDHRGLKARDIARATLALGIHRKQIEWFREDGVAASESVVDAMLDRMESGLSFQAAHDSLTGLPNRQQFFAAVEGASGVRFDAGAVLWIDIDQFRLINEIHGYEAGDELLVATAESLRKLNDDALVCHLGGDRFAVVRSDLSGERAVQHAQAMLAALHELSPRGVTHRLNLMVSIVVVDGSEVDGKASNLMHAADSGFAAAKAAGGDQVYVYRRDDPAIARRQQSVHWVSQVDDALDRGRLRLRCQPIVPLRPGGGMTRHFEVLLGVATDEAESLPIAEFIEAAERYNRMRAVDRWVARTVIDWIAAHRSLMPQLHGFAVNLSGQTAGDPEFVDYIRDLLGGASIDPSWLSFEVTETAAIADLTAGASIVQQLKQLGCKVALDDFGSGLASYSYLKELPVDWLKIDGVFIRKIAAGRDDYEVVRSINDIGHFLGKQTIAEYVVDDEVLGLVRQLGVDFGQGFGISPPMLMDDLVDLVASPAGSGPVRHST